jgi:hypothetical protein
VYQNLTLADCPFDIQAECDAVRSSGYSSTSKNLGEFINFGAKAGGDRLSTEVDTELVSYMDITGKQVQQVIRSSGGTSIEMNPFKIPNILGHETITMHPRWVLMHAGILGVKLEQAQLQGNIDEIIIYHTSYHNCGGERDMPLITDFFRYRSCTVLFLDYCTYRHFLVMAFIAVSVMSHFRNFKQYSEQGQIIPAGVSTYSIDYNRGSGGVAP